MERRFFIKQTSLVTTGLVAFSSTSIFADVTCEKSSTVIDIEPFSETALKIKLTGAILDAMTFESIKNCKLIIKTKKNRFFTTTRNIITENGNYTILSGFTSSGRIMEKVQVEIQAEGYKSYKSFIYLTTNGCNLHSQDWNYNSNFDFNLHAPKNEIIGNQVRSLFNFHMVKE